MFPLEPCECEVVLGNLNPKTLVPCYNRPANINKDIYVPLLTVRNLHERAGVRHTHALQRSHCIDTAGQVAITAARL
jgi:hypothetical protein